MIPVRPILYYKWLTYDGSAVIGEGAPIHTVYEVSARANPGGGLHVYVRGCLRRIDGTPSRVSRGRVVDLSALQPSWLARIIDDARSRLAERTTVGAGIAPEDDGGAGT